MPARARSQAMPTRGEWPLKPSPRPAARAACLIRREIWLRLSPNTLSAGVARRRIGSSADMVCAERKSTAPSPSGSVLERRSNSRPLPSASQLMSGQVRSAASETRSMASRIRLIKAMSRSPRARAVSARSSAPPRPHRGRRAVERMAARPSAVSADACFCMLPTRRVALRRVRLTSGPAQGSLSPAALCAKAIAEAATRRVAGLWPYSSIRSAR